MTLSTWFCFELFSSSLIFTYTTAQLTFSIRTVNIYPTYCHTHTHNRFMALWILSGKSRVSRYQKKHSLTHLWWSSIIPYMLPPSITIHSVCSIYVPDSLLTQSLCGFSLVYFLAWHIPLYTTCISSPMTVFFSQHMLIASQPVWL